MSSMVVGTDLQGRIKVEHHRRGQPGHGGVDERDEYVAPLPLLLSAGRLRQRHRETLHRRVQRHEEEEAEGDVRLPRVEARSEVDVPGRGLGGGVHVPGVLRRCRRHLVTVCDVTDTKCVTSDALVLQGVY